MTEEQNLERELLLANELEEMRINMLINIGVCCEDRYRDYLGRLINREFKELSAKIKLPKHQSETAAKFAKAFDITFAQDENGNPTEETP